MRYNSRMSKEVIRLILGYIAMMNLISFAMFGIDKAKAKRHSRRIPENALMMSAWLSGAPGAMLGMRVFHHKTRHRLFQYGIPPAVLLWTGVIVLLVFRLTV